MIGSLVELAVREPLASEGDGDGVGRAVHLLLEELVDADVRRIGGVDVVPGEEDLTLAPGQDRELGEVSAGVGDDAFEERLEVREHAFDRGAVEEVGGKLEGSADTAARLGHGEREIELGSAGSPRLHDGA